MTKINCSRKSCQFCFGGICGKGTVKITSDGCQSYKDDGGQKDPDVWSTDPWDNYDNQLLKMRLLREDKISKNDVNQDT